MVGISPALAAGQPTDRTLLGSGTRDIGEAPNAGPESPRSPAPILAARGNRFFLDGRPFEMWGIRTASGTKDDAQCDHLVAQLDDYKAYGVNTIAVFYQGCRGANYDPFSPDGREVDPGHQERMGRIIAACARRGMVVVVGLFYQAAPFGMHDAEAVRNAVRTVAAGLKSHRNVIVNIANEQNSGEWKDTAVIYDFREPQRII